MKKLMRVAVLLCAMLSLTLCGAMAKGEENVVRVEMEPLAQTPAEPPYPMYTTAPVETAAPKQSEPTYPSVGLRVEPGENTLRVVLVNGDTTKGIMISVEGPNGYSRDFAIECMGESETLKNLAPGAYYVEGDYVQYVPGTWAYKSGAVQVTGGGVQKPVNVRTSVTAGEDSIQVWLTQADALPVTVSIWKDGKSFGSRNLAGGNYGPAEFTGLGAGLYEVRANYTDNYGTEAAVEQAYVSGKRQAITITDVNPGERKITISGTAHPNTDVTLTTYPASTTEIVRANHEGWFSASVYCAAGTYTEVAAQYGGDTASRVVRKGTFVVTGQIVKPDITIDTVTTKSTTVSARTTPGVRVRIETYDYSVDATADSRGIIYVSLPHCYGVGNYVRFTVYYGVGDSESYQRVVTVAEDTTYPLLKYGSYGSDVYHLTARLAELHYPVSARMYYDDEVVRAVGLFQRLNYLAEDGQAGDETQRRLYSSSAIGYTEEEYPTYVRGDRGAKGIYNLQYRLKELGYYTIGVDGIFGASTERAVRDFQSMNGLYPSGRADNAMQKVLYSSSAIPAHYTPGHYKTLSRSNVYQSAVVPMQRRLKELGYLSGSADGYFGSKTYYAVRSFQSRNGLSVTGVADPKTQQILYSSSAIPAGGGHSDYGYQLLYWGCKGQNVVRLQTALKEKGYTQVRYVDGIYGQWTYDAVRAFQRDHGLAVDGIAGRKTQNALYGTHY